MKRQVYADNAATTKLSEKALQAMLTVLREDYGNPSSLYALGRQARKIVELSRKQIAETMGAQPGEIYFTSGGSEADNWAIRGAALQMAARGKKHIISSAFEHHAVLHTLDFLKKRGYEITLLPVHENGIVRVEELEAALRPDTGLVTIMFANNEIGTIQPIQEIGALCKERKILFHTDAVQAYGQIAFRVGDLGVDMLSVSAHKIHGPKGVGALYIRKGLAVPNLIFGGSQERGKRAGTENTAGIAGFAAAAEDMVAGIPKRAAHLQALRDHFIEEVLKIERCRLNGDPAQRLPGNVNVCFEGIEGESLLLFLDMNGVAASSGSACTSGSLDPSHVLLAIGLPHEIAHGSLRLSFSDENTMEDVDYILSVLPGIVNRLRNMSPLWERIKAEEQNQQS